MTAKQLGELASRVYATQSEEEQASAEIALAAALIEFGIKNVQIVVDRLKRYSGNCWFCCVASQLPDADVKNYLNGVCQDQPPSRWPSTAKLGLSD